MKTESQENDGSGSSKRKKQKVTHTTTSTSEPPRFVPIIDVPESSDEEEAETSDTVKEADGEGEEAEPRLQAAKEACEKSGNPKGDNENTIKNMPLTATITDADVFDCPICFENLTIPVHQCVYRHVACDSCCRKMNKKCPSCSWPMGYRSRIMERVLEVVQVSCGNLIYGCQDIMKLCDKREHEYKCVYTRCPMQDCDFVDSVSKLYQHFAENHKVTTFRFTESFSVPIDRNRRFLYLQETSSGAIFVLYQSNLQGIGIAASIVLIAPKSSTGEYLYELEAKSSKGRTLMESEVTSITKLVDYSPARYLVILEDFLNPLGQVTLQIRIHRGEKVEREREATQRSE